MAINLDVQDIDNYPGTLKRVTVDQDTIVPTGFEGDEQFVITVATSAYSNNTNRTAIPTTYITDQNIGWAKSSGLAGIGGKFALDATHNQMKIKMDATVSGSDQTGYYTITLNYNTDNTSVKGEVVAADIEEKIRAISCVAADAGYQKAYSNSTVEWKDGKFWIMSGTIGRYYTGQYKSSVRVATATSNDCSALLGFSTQVTSEDVANRTVAESLITADYTGGDGTMSINTGTGVVPGNCISISNGTTTEYALVLTVTGTALTLSDTTVTGTYTTAAYSRIQILKEQDPDVAPIPYCSSVDDLIRYGVKNTINQIDFSS